MATGKMNFVQRRPLLNDLTIFYYLYDFIRTNTLQYNIIYYYVFVYCSRPLRNRVFAAEQLSATRD